MDGSWSIHLNEKSSYLTTFNTPCGRYQFLHMPFGLKMSQDVFQMQMDQTTDHLLNIIVIDDDICIYGCTPKKNDWHNLQLVKTAKEHNIVFSNSKCQIRQPPITLLSCSVHHTRHAAKSIQFPSHPRPSNTQFPCKTSALPRPDKLPPNFIPSLSDKIMFLQEQLTEWGWNPSRNAAFQWVKAWICQTLLSTTLTYYDWSKPVIVQTDTRKYGLGAALIQISCSSAFSSKTLTDFETHFVNIEGECLSVCFGLEKFHTYLYSRHLIIQNDHRPLEMIQQKPIHAVPSQLQHILLCMQKYDYTIEYKSSKEMVLANCLSHFPFHKESLPIPIHWNIQHVQLSTAELDAIWGAI